MVAPSKSKEDHDASIRHVDAAEPRVSRRAVYSNPPQAQRPFEYLG